MMWRRLLPGLLLLHAACSHGGADGWFPSSDGFPASRDLGSGRFDLSRGPAAPPTFGPPTKVAVQGSQGTIAAADVNGDGIADVVLGIPTQGGFAIFLGKGDGSVSFKGAVGGSVGAVSLSQVVVADINGDGKPDALASSFYQSRVLVALGNGDGSFINSYLISLAQSAQGLAIGDLNGDRKPDLAVALLQTSRVALLRGKGDGQFETPTQIGIGTSPLGIAVGDLSGDAIPDLVIAESAGSKLDLLFGKGDGSFGAVTAVDTTAEPHYVALGDLNRDGILDVVTTNAAGVGVAVQLGSGGGRFVAARSYPLASGSGQLVVIDLNRDGILDVAAPDLQSHVVVYTGQGDGSLAAGVLIPAGLTDASGIAAGDFNRDGRPDLVIASASGAGFTIVQNTSGLMP
jgi:hypothetical protein